MVRPWHQLRNPGHLLSWCWTLSWRGLAKIGQMIALATRTVEGEMSARQAARRSWKGAVQTSPRLGARTPPSFRSGTRVWLVECLKALYRHLRRLKLKEWWRCNRDHAFGDYV